MNADYWKIEILKVDFHAWPGGDCDSLVRARANPSATADRNVQLGIDTIKVASGESLHSSLVTE